MLLFVATNLNECNSRYKNLSSANADAESEACILTVVLLQNLPDLTMPVNKEKFYA